MAGLEPAMEMLGCLFLVTPTPKCYQFGHEFRPESLSR